jgi:hypothetical protein
VSFGGYVGLGCFQELGKFGCLVGASSIFWALSVMGAPCKFRVVGLILVRLMRFFFLLVGFNSSCVYSWCT